MPDETEDWEDAEIETSINALLEKIVSEAKAPVDACLFSAKAFGEIASRLRKKADFYFKIHSMFAEHGASLEKRKSE